MATGSGKTLVLVKLIEVVAGLIQRGEIPAHDILILSCRDDLLEQLRKHVHEFNAARSDLFIHLRELREYADAKRDNPVLFKDREFTVFCYRSDNLSDEQKEKIIDFRNYDDGGKWYVLLRVGVLAQLAQMDVKVASGDVKLPDILLQLL